MNFTAGAYTGPRPVTFTATNENGMSQVVRSGSAGTLQAVAVHMGLRGEIGPVGPAGGAMTGGAGIVVVGTEIRLSIGTLPQMG